MVWNEPLAVKVADNPHSISMLRNEVRRSCGVKSRHPNLLGIRDDSLVRAAFHEAGKNSKYFAAVLMPDCGSVRNIMRKRGGGFQGREDLILCVLRSILNALDFLHQQHIPHGDITAGHVYLTSPRRFHTCSPLKLGFAATLYHEDETAPGTTCSASLPMSSISQWAAAPEVAVASHNSDYKHLYSEEKADIWLVGITALELAYGGLQLPNRNALEAMLKDILHNNKLPAPATNRSHKQITIETERTHFLKHYARKLLPQFSFSSSSPFSSTFTSMVIQCLAWDPTKRPTAHKLLSHKFFQKKFPRYEDDGNYFYHHVLGDQMNNLTIHD
ncbi:unnamed protein product [Cuscuta epithymum]|uniref:Protein kinase domain-containing protein n=1 Tax=Cuscuta epithymum TaxID=186058 RepID=A0AAV0GA13_9ASTE|nr:unnamed protein product [Cuscuta epithymum]